MTSDCVVPVEKVEFVVTTWSWPFAAQRRAEIDNYFAQQQRANPTLWNGRVLLLRDFDLKDSLLRGTLFETDYASLLAGIDWQAMGDKVKACFGAAALLTSDQAYIVGVMAPHTRNRGQIYFPSGALDPQDLVGTSVDLCRNVRRELVEETGLLAEDYDYQRGWCAIFAGPRLPVVKIVHVRETGDALRNRILRNLAAQTSPEFADIHLVRGPSDLDPHMPPWMKKFFTYVWR